MARHWKCLYLLIISEQIYQSDTNSLSFPTEFYFFLQKHSYPHVLPVFDTRLLSIPISTIPLWKNIFSGSHLEFCHLRFHLSSLKHSQILYGCFLPSIITTMSGKNHSAEILITLYTRITSSEVNNSCVIHAMLKICEPQDTRRSAWFEELSVFVDSFIGCSWFMSVSWVIFPFILPLCCTSPWQQFIWVITHA